MRAIRDSDVYGEMPASIETIFANALRREETTVKRKSVAAILLAAMFTLLLAAVALAVAHSLHLIDMIGLGKVNPEEAKTAISTTVEQSGGEMDLGTFKVTEAFYDGKLLSFIVEGEFVEETVMISESFMHMLDTENIANLPGTRVGVRASAACPALERQPTVYPMYDGEGRVLVGSAFIPAGDGAEELRIDLSIDLLNIDDGSILGSTALTFTVPRTVEATTTEFTVDAQTDFVVVEKVTIARTPLEVFASVEYRPLLRAFGGFAVVPDDGYVQKDRIPYSYSTRSERPALNNGKGTVDFRLPVEHVEGDSLTLWIEGSDQAIVIDLHTGEASVKQVIAHIDSENKKIEIVED